MIPIGVGASFQNLQPGVQTPTFAMDAGQAIVYFRAPDPNDPGTLTLYTSDGTVQTTMNADGYSTWFVPTGGASYYFIGTNGIRVVAMIHPSVWR